MPTLLVVFGYRFYFFLNEHRPIHVHIKAKSGKAKIELEPEVRVVYSKGLKDQELSKAIELCNMYKEEFVAAWHKRFGYGKN